MKNVLLILFIITSQNCFSQNYQCLQIGKKPFYINGNGYLRGMRIDSVVTNGSNTIYFPYHTPRNVYNVWGVPDSTASSWLGKAVIEDSNGAFYFDNMWNNDSIILKSKAQPGDSWTFFADTTSFSYKATVTATDTMTILGITDSVKVITIESDSAGAVYSSDPVNGFQIILSKNNGFVQIFDLYTFPYHEPGNTRYRKPLSDYYLDLVEGAIVCNCDMPPSYNNATVQNSIFHLVPFHNPTLIEVNNFSVGEILEYHNYFSEYSGAYLGSSTTVDTIITKSTSATSVTYTMATATSGTTEVCCPVITHSYESGVTSVTYDKTYLIDTVLMPEEWNNRYFYHFFPKVNYDSVNICPDTVCIVDVNNIAYPSGTIIFETTSYGMGFEGNITDAYGIGVGQYSESINNYTAATTAGPSNSSSNQCFYVSDNGVSCGGFVPVLSVGQTKLNSRISVYPNPASNNINFEYPQQDNITITLSDISGRILAIQQSQNSTHTVFDLSMFTSGIFLYHVITPSYSQTGKFIISDR